MARKNLLKDLMNASDPPPATDAPAPSDKRASRGAIGAVSRSIAELKSRSVVELDPFSIKSGGLRDRLEHFDEDHDRLMESLRVYGQQVPVLVRPHPDPEHEGLYQIVYGRRRVLALQDLKLPVKAMIRDLDDDAVIMAQGQENSARRDLSFVEKVNFARQMHDAGYDRKLIADALSTDKTLISRMMAVASSVPTELIEMIGAAPGIGRDRWTSFAKNWQDADLEPDDARAMLAVFLPTTSDGRFDALANWLTNRKPTPKPPGTGPEKPEKQTLKDPAGSIFARLSRSPSAVTITLPQKPDGFADWLSEHLDDIHRDWTKSQGE